MSCVVIDFAGVMARSVEDVILFDGIFSDCQPKQAVPPVELKGLRIGLPTNWWTDLGNEARCLTIIGAFDDSFVGFPGIAIMKFLQQSAKFR